MEIILLERVENLGQMGDVVKVKPGFARNFLLPQKKALRANEANRKVFERQRAELEARNLERRKEAVAAAKSVDGRSFVIIRQASESGVLYGSVSTRDIADAATAEAVKIERTQVRIDKPLKSLGVFTVRIVLHPEVDASIQVNIARSEDEAERQARGEDVLARQEDQAAEEEKGATPDKTAEFFDEGAQRPVADNETEKSSDEEAGAQKEKD